MIFLGPGGTGGLGYDEAFSKLHGLGLNALEVEFTYGVKMPVDEAARVGESAKRNGIKLSVHGPYYINLASEEKEKIGASRSRIIESCRRAEYLGAHYVVFHAGFYQKKSREATYAIILEQIRKIQDEIKENKWKVQIAPELTGKATQFGDIDELLRLSKEAKCHFTIDFSHWQARTQGKMSFAEMFDRLKGVKYIHGHFSGIEYTEKGERRHILTPDDGIMGLMKEAVKSKIDTTIINESPEPVEDSVKTLRILKTLA